ncbi:MAG: HD-GYP domain-containing protein [bacterium]
MKKITVKQLKVGMYISDINSGWSEHPFLLNHFPVKNSNTINKIISVGIKEVYIDPSKGIDVPDAPTDIDIKKKINGDMINIARDKKQNEKKELFRKVTIQEEIGNAKKIHCEAVKIVRNAMNEARLGRQVSIKWLEPVVGEIYESIMRCPDALLSLCRVKNKDDYTFQHSVSVSALQVAFSCSIGLDERSIYFAGIGGLLHDIGKIMIPDNILNKPDKLTEDEFVIMKSHVIEGKKILDLVEGIEEISKQIAYEHHERYDGTGYPKGLRGEEISGTGRMAAICDVYDAITSNRVYRRGIMPNEALSKILEWSSFHFDRFLVEKFVRTVGIYPVGTLVQLEFDLIGVVAEQYADNLLCPIVKVIYDSKRGRYINPVYLDLSEKSADNEIVGLVLHEKLDIDPLSFLF